MILTKEDLEMQRKESKHQKLHNIMVEVQIVRFPKYTEFENQNIRTKYQMLHYNI